MRENIVGVVIFYEPTDLEILNINSYIQEIDTLYVVDNSAKSNSHRLPEFDNIVYMFNGRNDGIAKPINDVAEIARGKGYKWLLTLDQDTNLPKGMVLQFRAILSEADDDIGIISPWHNTKSREKKPKEEIDFPLDVMTSGNFLDLNIHKEIGGFKEWLLIDGVDIEYCLNLRKHNFRVARYNSFEIEHELGDIEFRKFLHKEFYVSNHSAFRRYYQWRNYKCIAKMYKDDFPEFCYRLGKLKWMVLSIILFENDKLNKLIAMTKGYVDHFDMMRKIS